MLRQSQCSGDQLHHVRMVTVIFTLNLLYSLSAGLSAHLRLRLRVEAAFSVCDKLTLLLCLKGSMCTYVVICACTALQCALATVLQGC